MSLTLHRNPLFDRALGLTPHRSLTIDILHQLHLGVMHSWCKHVIWVLLRANIWGAAVGSREERDQNNALCFKSALDTWYKATHNENPKLLLTRAHDITLKMVGTAAKPKFKFSASETWGVLNFIVHRLKVDSLRIGKNVCRPLIHAGEALIVFVNKIQIAPPNIPGDVMEDRVGKTVGRTVGPKH